MEPIEKDFSVLEAVESLRQGASEDFQAAEKTLESVRENVRLSSLLSLVEDLWPFDEEHYPGYDALSRRQQLYFAINHIQKHMMKAMGELATPMEVVDHGGEAHFVTRGNRETAVKLLMNALRLAVLIEVSPQEIVETIRKLSEPKA